MNTYRVKASPHNEDVPALSAMKSENHWLLEHKAGTLSFTGRLLGYASSHRQLHSHALRDVAASLTGRLPHRRCPACRWQEVRIFRVDEPTSPDPRHGLAPYVVHTLGPSVVQGETTFGRVEEALTGHEVIELLTVRMTTREGPFLPAAAARALSQASGLDEGIRDAFENRRVA